MIDADRVAESLFGAFAIADAMGDVGSLHLSADRTPDCLLAWAAREQAVVAAEELERESDGATIRWTLYRVTLVHGSEITAHGPDRCDRPADPATEPEVAL